MSLLSAPLQAFQLIVEFGTVHAAARELGLTQTAVTQRLKSLESSVGAALFLRSRKGMRLTSEGEALLRYCRRANELEGETLSKISGPGVNQEVSVTVAGPTSVLNARVVPQCLELYPAFPDLRLHFTVIDERDRIGMLRSGEADFAIVAPDVVPNELTGKTLKPEKYILVAAAAWRQRRLVEILKKERIIDFNERDRTTISYLEKFDLDSSVGRSRIFVNSNEAIIRMFCAGVGFGTLTQETAKPFVQSGELIMLNGGAALENRLALAWYPRKQMPLYFSAITRSIS